MDNITRKYGGDWQEKYLYFFGIALATLLITSDTMAIKFFEVGGLKFGGGMLFIPFCLIVGDIVTEVYGFKKTRKIIIASLLAFMFFTVASQLVIALPPAAEWKLQQPFELIFRQSPRIFVAGCLAYLAGELSNSWVMSRLKTYTDGRHFWLRAVASTIVAEAANTVVFQFTGFFGIMPTLFLAKVILNGTAIKIVGEVVLLPVTALICRKLKRLEGLDYFDNTAPYPEGRI